MFTIMPRPLLSVLLVSQDPKYEKWFTFVHHTLSILMSYWTPLHSYSQSLREEVTHLTRSLRRAETETKVLQEALEGQLDSNCQPVATNWIQEKVWLSQEVTQS